MITPNIQQRYFQDGKPTIEGQLLLESIVRAIEALEASSPENGVEELDAELVAALSLLTTQQLGWLGQLTAYAATLLDDADATEAQSTLGLVPGTDVLAYDALLQAIAGLTTSADKMIYTTGSDAVALADLTAAGRAILDDADADAQRTTLGLTDAATANLTSGEWTVTLSDESGNDSPTTVVGVYQRFNNVIEAGFSGLNDIDTTGLTGTDAVRVSLPDTWRGYITGNLVVSSISGTVPMVPYGAAAADYFNIATTQTGTLLTVSQLTDDAADILQCGLRFSLVGNESILLLSGDEQTGTDGLLLSGDEQSGSDLLLLSGTP